MVKFCLYHFELVEQVQLMLVCFCTKWRGNNITWPKEMWTCTFFSAGRMQQYLRSKIQRAGVQPLGHFRMFDWANKCFILYLGAWAMKYPQVLCQTALPGLRSYVFRSAMFVSVRFALENSVGLGLNAFSGTIMAKKILQMKPSEELRCSSIIPVTQF